MEWLTLVLSLVAGLFGIHYFFFRKLNKFEKLGILHIKPLPGFGNMAPAIFRMYPIAETVNKAYQLNDEAKYVGFYDFGEPTIMIRSLDLIKDITIKHFDHFVDHRGFVDATQDPLFGNNLFSLRGEKWKEIRNLLTPAFTSSKMKAMFKLMSNCGKNFADYVANRASNEPYVIKSKDAFTRYTNDVIATCAFGISIDSMRNRNNEFYVLGRKALDLDGALSFKFFLVRSFPRISKFFNVRLIDKKVENFFENVVRETIETRDREGITRPDMLQLMMESRNNKSSDGPQLSITDMTAQAFVFFLGGFDTTSMLMCFATHEIAVDPTIQKKLQDEVDKVLEETNGDVTYDAINKMQYLDALINETLRLYPIGIFLDRQCVKTYELPPAFPGAKTVTLQPGDNVWIPVYSLQRDPKYFPNPETFDPERFMKNGQSNVDPLAYVPFGLGPRMCIGNRFALLETKVLIFHLLSKCHLKPAAKTRVPLELSTSSFAMTAKGGFWLQIEPRNDISALTNVKSNGVAK